MLYIAAVFTAGENTTFPLDLPVTEASEFYLDMVKGIARP